MFVRVLHPWRSRLRHNAAAAIPRPHFQRPSSCGLLAVAFWLWPSDSVAGQPSELAAPSTEALTHSDSILVRQSVPCTANTVARKRTRYSTLSTFEGESEGGVLNVQPMVRCCRERETGGMVLLDSRRTLKWFKIA